MPGQQQVGHPDDPQHAGGAKPGVSAGRRLVRHAEHLADAAERRTGIDLQRVGDLAIQFGVRVGSHRSAATARTVKECAGIDFPGEFTQAEFVLVDLTDVDRSDPRFARLPLFERGPNGLLVILPISGDTVRVVAHEYGTPYRDRRGMPTK